MIKTLLSHKTFTESLIFCSKIFIHYYLNNQFEFSLLKLNNLNYRLHSIEFIIKNDLVIQNHNKFND